ncbi:RHS repeat-associated core domain protein-containing protein [Flavobacterium seoulense]|uniref:RHS repeat-associated core domain protein-containing protein n=1 Tax=Flavobacterium seoulense TaxID=1492738 RepID=A0A066WVM7_9FLAO|nr:RHS repeat-associated core domain protein-containing protein [Flavobacterium seoulense]
MSAVIQPTSTVSTGSFTITNYNASYTYSAIPSAGVIFSGATVTAPPGNYIIVASLGGNSSSPSANVTVNAQPIIYNILSNENYIHTITPTTPTTNVNSLNNNEKIETIAYFDGLGRPMQNIGIRAGGNSHDIITPIEYDTFGRQVKDYLPYAAVSDGGLYRGSALAEVIPYYSNNSKYENTTNPYSEKQLEASPLNRILKQASPGYDWRLGSGNEIKLDYQSNGVNEVKNFGVSLSFADDTYTPTLTGGTTSYNVNELYKTVTKDENWQSGQLNPKDHTTEEFKDKQDKIILKRTYDNNIIHDTYYVYDDYGNLTYVIPPKASDLGVSSNSANQSNVSSTELVSSGNTLNLTATNSITLSDGFHAQAGSTFTATITGTANGNTNVLDELCYQYKYDYRNRLVEKKLPGKEWEYIVYDKLDRAVLTQDPNLKAQNKWLFTKYDAFSRPVYTGLISSSKSRTGLQGDLNLETIHFESRGTTPPLDGISTYYTNNSFPRTDIVELHIINYYDDYDFDKDGGVSEPVGTNPQIIPSTATKSLATGSKIRVLGSSNWITNVFYYDEKGRPIYNYSNNNFLGSIQKVKTDLDFVGKAMKTTTNHTKNNLTTTIIDNFTYDHQGRLLTQIQKINNQAEELLVSNVYDELGQLKEKGVGGKTTQSRLQKVDYTYNIRGWLKGINDSNSSNNDITMESGDLFGFKINYNNPSTGTALFNGNISQTYWKTTNPIDTNLKNYNYSYDALNRLTAAQYSLSTPNRFNENLTYDKNGNIMTLVRTGNTDANGSVFGTMDNLAYTYLGNRLNTVEDSSGSTEGFKDGSHTNQEYTYDDNGNMKTDANKGITAIAYNHLNLPTDVTLGGGTIHYDYDATGVKQRKIAAGTATDYAGGFQYEGVNLKFFPTAEGYAENNNGTFSYIYQYKDHLGNVRLSYKDVGTTTPSLHIVEESNYYPFGLKQKVTGELINNSSYKYKYNGKELQDENIGGVQLNLYDYGARNYDPALGRWMNIDPLAEKFSKISPYTYVANNPLNAIDPDGRDIIFLTRNNDGSVKEQFKYRNGNFYHENGKRYNPGKEGVSKTMYKVLTAYRTIEKSNDKILKNQLHTLEKSEQTHYVEQSPNKENAVTSLNRDASYFGKPAGTQTEYDFDVKYDGEKSDLGVVAHEMRHQFDHDIGNMQDNAKVNDANDPSEIRAVHNENRARKLEGKKPLSTYDGKEIDPEKLANPPNNRQK